MENNLKSIYLKLDSTTKSLTKNAISQLLIKIIFANTKSITLKDILVEYKKIINKKTVDENEINERLNQLVQEKEIIFSKGSYHISTNKSEKIQSSLKSSKKRKEEIIDNYFKPFHSDETIVKEWLEDATVFFFKSYSNEWISDICSRTSAVSNSKESIFSTIQVRTKNNNKLNRNDYEELSSKFAKFIITKDPDIDAYLWEYGTSSFAAQLIENSVGTDSFSIDIFKNCKCVLDTNILMHIGLESSEYYSALKSLETIFTKLNIEVGILNITKEEYQNTIGKKRDEILKSIEDYPFDVVKAAGDQYVKTAIARRCRDVSDFERFFSQLLNVPKYIYKSVEINLFDHDKILEAKIDKAKNDEDKQNKLNVIYKNATGHDKRKNALIHDVGLIVGVKYLREKGEDKYFVLSQEVSVNKYAKERPSVNDLPFAIKLETIINILAVNNGDIDIETKDYISLFASMVRNGLSPNKDCFKVEDLSIMYEKNMQIAQLPSDKTIEIAKEIHRRRLLGEEDNKISLELSRLIQGAKLQIVDDLDETKKQLSLEKTDKGRYIEKATKTEAALRKTIKEQVTKEYNKKLKNSRIKFYLGMPIMILFITMLFFLIYNYINKNTDNFTSTIIVFISTIIIEILFYFYKVAPAIIKLKKDKDKCINEETNNRFENQIK